MPEYNNESESAGRVRFILLVKEVLFDWRSRTFVKSAKERAAA